MKYKSICILWRHELPARVINVEDKEVGPTTNESFYGLLKWEDYNLSIVVFLGEQTSGVTIPKYSMTRLVQN